MRLVCNGVALDLKSGATLSFKKVNPLFAFDDLTCERTQSFDIPATPHNEAVFELSKLPAFYGTGMRRRFDCELQAGTVVKHGHLYVDAYTNGAYKGMFVTGELLGLQSIKNAGKIAEYLTPDDVAFFSGSTPANELSRIENYDAVQYARESGAHVIPSVNLQYLCQLCADYFGVNMQLPESVALARIVPNKPYGIKTHTARLHSEWEDKNGRINKLFPGDLLQSQFVTSEETPNIVWQKIYYNAQETQIMSETNRNAAAQEQQRVLQFKALANIKITFPEDFPTDVYMVALPTDGSISTPGTFFGEYSFSKTSNFDRSTGETITRTGNPLSGRTVEIPNGTRFTLVAESDYYSTNDWYYGTIGSYTGEIRQLTIGYEFRESDRLYQHFDFAVEVSGQNETAAVGEHVRLVDNLPDVTFVGLLKTVAALSGKQLNYTDERGIYFADIDPNVWRRIENAPVLKYGELSRKFADYAQRNNIVFDSDEYITNALRVVRTYVIDNDNIEMEKELQRVPFSEGATVIIDGYACAYIPHKDDEYTEKYTLAFATTTANKYMERPALIENTGITALCTQSTAVNVTLRMLLHEFEDITAETTILLHGTRYVWTEATWQNNVCTCKISKI